MFEKIFVAIIASLHSFTCHLLFHVLRSVRVLARCPRAGIEWEGVFHCTTVSAGLSYPSVISLGSATI